MAQIKLKQIKDVDISGIATGDILQWDTDKLTPFTPNYITSLAHNHVVANSAGTQQFTFGVGENIRFDASGSASVAFASATKTITISSTDTVFTHPTQTAIDVNATDNGINVIDRVVVNTLGHVTAVSTRNLSNATTGAAGVMSSADKTKLNGIASGAQVNVATNLTYTTATTSGTVNSSTGTNATIPAATTSLAGLMTNVDKTKLDGIAAGAQVNVATNLTYTTGATSGTVNSSTGTNATIPAATTSLAGLMTNTDKTKLNGIASGAQVNTVTSVASKTGAVTLVKSDVGLGSVDNTSDAAKPVSTAQQTALNLKLNTSARGAANGVASLDANSKIPESQLPNSVFDSLYFFASVGANANTRNLGLQAVAHALTENRSPIGYYWVVTANSATLTGGSGAVTVNGVVADLAEFNPGEESNDLTFNETLEVGDWFILTNVTGAGTSQSPYKFTFAAVNNTYELATNSVDGIVKLSSITSVNSSTTGSQVITQGVLGGLIGTTNTKIAAGSHTHAAGDITSGTFADARIPNLNASKITAGTFAVARGGTGRSTLASGEVLIGAGTGAITSLSRSGIDSRTVFPAAATNLGTAIVSTNSRSITSSTGSNITVPVVTTTVAGFMSHTDKTKLDGIASGAQVNVATNLTYTTGATTGTVTSSTGTNATIPAATTSLAGLMTNVDKTKLDGIAAGAQVNVATNLGTAVVSTNSRSITSSTGANVTVPVATTVVAGFMSHTDKTKLDGLVTNATHTGDVTGSGALTIANNAVTTAKIANNAVTTAKITNNAVNNAKLADMAVNTIKGRVTAGTGDPQDLTAAQVRTMLNVADGAQVNVATNLSYTTATTTGTVTSSTGSNATIPAATTSLAGLMTNTDKSKLDGIAAGAQVNVATNLGITAGNTAGPVVTSSTGSNATLPTATATNSGVVTTGAQTWAGEKTFTNKLTVSGSTAGQVVLDIQGTSGQLFSITDSLVGLLFSVNDISGIPVFETFSDGTVNIGTFGSPEVVVKSGAVALSGTATATTPTTAANNTQIATTAYVKAQGYVTSSGVTSVSGAGTVSGLTLTGTVTSTGSLTLGGTLSLTSGQVTTALGFTPYNSTNPSNFITTAGARSALSFAAGSGAYNNSTGVITIPTNTNQLTNGAGFTTNTGTVTSVTASAGTGITITGSPITTSGTLTITNSAPNATHTGDVTGSGALTIANNAVTTAKIANNAVTTAKIANNAVTNAKLADMAVNTIKGRSGSDGDPQDLTAAQVRTILNVADASHTHVISNVTGLQSALDAKDNYQFWSITDDIIDSPDKISSGNTLTVVGDGATTVTYDPSIRQLSISSTDTVFTHPTQTAIDVNATDNGINVIDRVVVNTLGHVTAVSTRNLSNATTGAAGVMSSADKTKLDGIASGAQVNVGTNIAQGTRTATTVPVTSSTGNNATLDIATTLLAGVMSSADKTKLDGIAASANNFVHPTGGANTTHTNANGRVLSSITVNNLGHVTAVGSKILAAADIPNLAASKITSGTLIIGRGGTGTTSLTSGNILVGNGTSAISAPYTVETTLTGGSSAIPRADAVKAYVDSLLASNDAMIFKGTLGTGGTHTSLPTTHDVGWTIKVITAGTYAGKVAEIGDMYVSLVTRSGSGNTNADWAVIQTNIDGAVVGPASAVNNRIATFNGTTGKLIKDSGFTIGTTVPSGAVFTDTNNFLTDVSGSGNGFVKFNRLGLTTLEWDSSHTHTAAQISNSTTVGRNLITLANPGAVTFLRVNANNTVSALSAANFRTAIGAGTGTLSSVNLGYTAAATNGVVTNTAGDNATIPAATTSFAGLMTNADKTKLNGIASGAQVNVATNLGITAGNTAGPVVTSSTGSNATLPTATATNSGVVTTGPQTWAGVKTFNSTISGSINGNAATATTATNVTGTVAIGNGGTGATTAAAARTNLGATTVGGNLFTLTNPGAVTFLRVNANNTVTALSAANFRTAIGAGTSSAPNATHTGDVTGSGALTIANNAVTTAKIANNAVTNAKLADMAVSRIKGRVTVDRGAPEDLTAAQVRTMLNVADGAQVNVATNLTYTTGATTGTVTSSTGSNATIPAATTSLAGLMTNADKTKLNGIAASANNFVHPTNNQQISIGNVNGQVLSSITVNNLGHVTAVGSKILAAADIPNLAASKITSGTFAVARIPNLNASKITAGTFAVARGGTGATSFGSTQLLMGNGTSAISSALVFYDSSMAAVGINQPPQGQAELEVYTGEEVRTGVSIFAQEDIVAFSDKSVKENIRTIDNVIERIVDSRGVMYDRTDTNSKDNIGFIAQELEVNFPELVFTNETTGLKSVKYQNTVAVLFEAIKEQQKQINELKDIINLK